MTPDDVAKVITSILAAVLTQQKTGGTEPAALNQAAVQSIVTAVTQQLLQNKTPAATDKPADTTPQTTTTTTTTGSGQSAVSNPSVQIGALGLAITTFLQAIGTIAPPFSTALGTGVAAAAGNATIPSPMLGTLATVIPLIVSGIGATSGWGSLLGIASTLIGAIGNAAKKQ